jgi:hypothetical protein
MRFGVSHKAHWFWFTVPNQEFMWSLEALVHLYHDEFYGAVSGLFQNKRKFGEREEMR